MGEVWTPSRTGEEDEYEVLALTAVFILSSIGLLKYEANVHGVVDLYFYSSSTIVERLCIAGRGGTYLDLSNTRRLP